MIQQGKRGAAHQCVTFTYSRRLCLSNYTHTKPDPTHHPNGIWIHSAILPQYSECSITWATYARSIWERGD